MVVESSAEESIASNGSPGHTDSPETQLLEQADAEGTQTGTPKGTLAISAEEEQLLLEGTASAPGESPASDTSYVTGHLALLQVNIPPHGELEDGDTSK